MIEKIRKICLNFKWIFESFVSYRPIEWSGFYKTLNIHYQFRFKQKSKNFSSIKVSIWPNRPWRRSLNFLEGWLNNQQHDIIILSSKSLWVEASNTSTAMTSIWNQCWDRALLEQCMLVSVKKQETKSLSKFLKKSAVNLPSCSWLWWILKKCTA